MRYEAFKACWQAALRESGLLTFGFPKETLGARYAGPAIRSLRRTERWARRRALPRDRGAFMEMVGASHRTNRLD